MTTIKPVQISGHQPNKWIRLLLTHNESGDQLEVFRSDGVCEYHLDIYNKFLTEISEQPLAITSVLDAGRIILLEPTKCHLFGYSTYFKIPSPELSLDEQRTIRESSKQTLESHGYHVELGEIW